MPASVARQILDADPAFRLSAFAASHPYRDKSTLNALVEGLSAVGLPD
jgi:hypothetical protein